MDDTLNIVDPLGTGRLDSGERHTTRRKFFSKLLEKSPDGQVDCGNACEIAKGRRDSIIANVLVAPSMQNLPARSLWAGLKRTGRRLIMPLFRAVRTNAGQPGSRGVVYDRSHESASDGALGRGALHFGLFVRTPVNRKSWR